MLTGVLNSEKKARAKHARNGYSHGKHFITGKLYQVTQALLFPGSNVVPKCGVGIKDYYRLAELMIDKTAVLLPALGLAKRSWGQQYLKQTISIYCQAFFTNSDLSFIGPIPSILQSIS